MQQEISTIKDQKYISIAALPQDVTRLHYATASCTSTHWEFGKSVITRALSKGTDLLFLPLAGKRGIFSPH